MIPQWSWLFPTGLSASDIARGSILCVFAYWGWDACLPTSEETKDPHKNPGKAAVLATILVLGTYVLVSYAIQAFAGFGTTGIGLNNPQNANDTLRILGEPVVGSGVAVVLLLAISSSSLASVLTCLAPTARSMLAMGVYRALPQPFAKVHRRYQTRGSAPSWWLSGCDISGDGAGRPELVGGHGGLAGAGDRLVLRHHSLCVCLDLPAHAADLGRDFWLRGALPFVGAVAITWVFVQSAIDMYAPDYGKTHFGPVGGVFVMGWACWCWASRSRR